MQVKGLNGFIVSVIDRADYYAYINEACTILDKKSKKRNWGILGIEPRASRRFELSKQSPKARIIPLDHTPDFENYEDSIFICLFKASEVTKTNELEVTLTRYHHRRACES